MTSLSEPGRALSHTSSNSASKRTSPSRPALPISNGGGLQLICKIYAPVDAKLAATCADSGTRRLAWLLRNDADVLSSQIRRINVRSMQLLAGRVRLNLVVASRPTLDRYLSPLEHQHARYATHRTQVSDPLVVCCPGRPTIRFVREYRSRSTAVAQPTRHAACLRLRWRIGSRSWFSGAPKCRIAGFLNGPDGRAS